MQPHGEWRCAFRGGPLCHECDGCGEVLKEEAQLVLLPLKNEGSRTTEGMIGNSSPLAAVLTVVSTVSLSLLFLLCMRCKRKSKVIHEGQQEYDPHTFRRGGSVFAVTQSKTVTRANQINSATVEIQEDFSPDSADDQSDYENIKEPDTPCNAAPQTGSLEHTYVAPLPNSVYENEKNEIDIDEADQTQGVYANFIQSLPIDDDDEDSYENAGYLEQVRQNEEDSDEPDYVNES
ncbi:uncharacterized protein LOC121191011 [Toxotes jaculatrix]|uniref:uncharacterized protein LOC121191011 n=1 Tax=Toxotes jaculatrix TaxID=941984 RepID=UPI001B3B10CE|nr:uncharacterized protein LOC121191011 [Toxotes jaculatrix]